MAEKLDLPDIGTLGNPITARAAINSNFTAIENAFDNTLSRDGTTPNQMEADIDMNGNDLLNVNRIDADEIYKNGVPFEQDIAYANKLYQLFSGTGAQTVFTLTEDPGSLGNLYVSVGGSDLKPGIDYTYSGTSLTFTVAPASGTNNIYVRYDRALPTGVTTADAVSYTPPSTGVVTTIKNFLDFFWSTGTNLGATLIRWIQTGTGAVARTVESKLREQVSVADFGAVEDGVTNDTAAFQAAIDSLGTGGGVVRFKGKALLTTGLVIKEGVTLRGDLGRPGVPGAGNSDASNIFNLKSTLLLPSGQTISMRGSSCLEGLVVRRSTMTGSENDPSAYAGTAITIAGDDVCVRDCLVLGFNKFLLSSGFQRMNVLFTNFDCVNGIDITNCFDVARIHNVHGWPFGTIDAAAPTSTAIDATHYLFRNGTAFKLAGGNDWSKITDCFSYGYLNGFLIEDPANVTLTGCGADNISSGTNVVANSAGFTISGTTNEITLVHCQCAAQDYGYSFFASTATQKAIMTGCTAWGIKSGGLRVTDFDLSASNCSFRGRSGVVGQGVVISGANADVELDDITIQDFNDSIVGGSIRTVRYNGIRILTCANNPANTLLPQVATADPLNLMPVSQYAAAEVTGNTNFGNITPTYAGHVIVLKFTGTPTAFDGGNAKLSANFVATADDTLTLMCDGVNWIEVARSAN